MAEHRQRTVGGFQQAFNTPAQWLIQCPGRVNLIGEHIDYNGYGVLPMAIEQSVFLAVSANDENVIRFRNSAEKFESHDWPIDTQWAGGDSAPRWCSYFLCGWRGAIDALAERNIEHTPVGGLNIYIHGTVPPAAGLSSSSAMVCAAVLASWTVYTGKPFKGITKSELADIATKTERLIGVEGGGMDQAAAVLSEEGAALRIDFNPLKATHVILPTDAVFCVLHSGVDSQKAAHNFYNERVVECRIAAQLLYREVFPGAEDWDKIRRLGDFQKASGYNFDECIAHARARFEDRVYTRAELIEALNVSEEEFVAKSLNPRTADKTEFRLLSRAYHVFSEAQRVDDAVEACLFNDIERLGDLMNQSHASCQGLYECSCAEMDALVGKCREAGAIGARLTGAGWGGCAVALVHKDKVEQFSKDVDVLFTSKPSAGIRALLLS